MRPSLLLGLVLPILFVSGTLRSADPDCDAPDFCRPEVARINAAFSSGMAKAKDSEARLLCLRLRNASLAMLVESTYQATLAWAADRPDFLCALQRDQARWLDDLEADRNRDNSIGALERRADLLIERLRLFGKIADGRSADAFVVG